MSETSSDRRKMKELKVLELHREGYSYRKIASSVHLSLRDVTKYIHRISNKTKSPSTTSVMDEVVLEYRVNMLRSEVRDLEIQISNLKDELEDLRAQIWNMQYKLRDKQSELDVVRRDLDYEKFSKEILNGIFTKCH
jgi:predicted  nucleic acid-binding Zn-ribbon protein